MDEQEAALAARAEARLGTTLRGKYRLDRVLGVGGMASVYAATHRNQAELAIKVLHPELSFREDIRKRFLREGYVANSVKHAGSVLVVDDDVAEDGSAFLVMELLSGITVEQAWERRGRCLPTNATCAIALSLLDVLIAAHAKAIVHRDLKPANLFLTRDGALKVLDFGIARIRDSFDSAMSSTAAGTLLGTPAFIAPEQALARAEDIDGQTDLFAVGATMFTLLSGTLVHEGANSSQIVVKAATTPVRSLATAAPDVGRAIAMVVDRALSFEKSGRWRDAAEMMGALKDACTRTMGIVPGRDALLSILDSHELETATTGRVNLSTTAKLEPPRVVVRSDLESGPHAATELSVPRVAGMLESGPRAFPGRTTSNPVSQPRAPRTRRRNFVPAWIGGVMLLSLALFFGVRGRGLPSAATTVSVEPPAPAAAVTVASAPESGPAPDPSVAASTAATLTANSAPSASSAPPTHPAASAPGHRSIPALASPSATATPKPECAPYTVDANNHKHWNLDCVREK